MSHMSWSWFWLQRAMRTVDYYHYWDVLEKSLRSKPNMNFVGLPSSSPSGIPTILMLFLQERASRSLNLVWSCCLVLTKLDNTLSKCIMHSSWSLSVSIWVVAWFSKSASVISSDCIFTSKVSKHSLIPWRTESDTSLQSSLQGQNCVFGPGWLV